MADIKKIIKETNLFHTILVKKDYAGLDRVVTAIKGIAYEKKEN